VCSVPISIASMEELDASFVRIAVGRTCFSAKPAAIGAQWLSLKLCDGLAKMELFALL
jgi:hypothetical protein